MLGERIKQAVEDSKIPKSRIADLIDTSEQNLHRLFKKESVETKYLEKLCQVLQIPMSYFFKENWESNVNHVNQGIAVNYGKNTTQKFNNMGECIERVRGLEREVELLREMNDMLKGRK